LPFDFGAQSPMTSTNNLEPVPIVTSSTQKLKSKTSRFLNRIYKTFLMSRGFEQLSSSIGCRVMTEHVSASWRTNSGARGS